MAWYWGLLRAERGKGSKSSSSVWGGCFSGKMRFLKDMVRKASAPSHESDTALQRRQTSTHCLCHESDTALQCRQTSIHCLCQASDTVLQLWHTSTHCLCGAKSAIERFSYDMVRSAFAPSQESDTALQRRQTSTHCRCQESDTALQRRQTSTHCRCQESDTALQRRRTSSMSVGVKAPKHCEIVTTRDEYAFAPNQESDTAPQRRQTPTHCPCGVKPLRHSEIVA